MTNVTVIKLPAGAGVTGKPVTVLLLSLGDCPVKKMMPSGAVTTTMICTTLVLVLGSETSTRMGAMSDGKGKMTVPSVVRKSTPGWPGLRSEVDEVGDWSMSVAPVMYCALPIPGEENMIKSTSSNQISCSIFNRFFRRMESYQSVVKGKTHRSITPRHVWRE